jgi:LuxR family maltose regulon positive regulatory protein
MLYQRLSNSYGKAAWRQHAGTRQIKMAQPVPYPLLTTKLSLPPARLDSIPRSRLGVQLDQALHHSLTLISAPAGFGKTTLLSNWCQTLSNHSGILTAWLSLDAGDNNVTRFWHYIVAALCTACPELEAQLLPSSRALPQPSAEEFLTTLINTLASIPYTLLLALDDYHVISEPAIHEGFTFLIEHMPPHFHLIITSRTDPPLPLIRWRAQGQLHELHTGDLRFTLTEVGAFLRKTMQLNLSQSEVAALDAHTEGWVAGLQLAALSLQGRQDTTRFIATFTGSHRYIFDYLTGEVLQRQPEQVRAFLLQTSILEHLSAPLCNAVTGRSDGQEMLTYLEQANLFLLPLDEQRKWYRYHHLFAEFLHEHLLQAYPQLVPQLHLRASQWYEQQGLISATLDHALAADDKERVAQLAEQFAQTMITRGEITSFLRWLSALPETVIRAHPRLRLYQAGCMIGIGLLDQAEAYIEEVASITEQLERSADDEPVHSGVHAGELLSVQVALAAYRGEVEQTKLLAAKALAIIPKEDLFTRSLVITCLGLAHVFSGDAISAHEIFREAVALGEQAQNNFAWLGSIASQGYLQIVQGRLREAEATSKEVIRLGTRQDGRYFSIVSAARACLSELAYEWNDLAASERYAREGIESGKRWGYIGALAQQYSVLIRIEVARGNLEQAQALLQQIEQQARAYTFPYVTSLLAAERIRLQLHLNNLEAAEQAVQSADPARDDLFTFPHEIQHLARIQAYIARGQLDGARQIAECLLAAAEPAGHMRTVIQTLVLLALVLHKKDQQDLAIQILARALALAEPENYLRTFIDAGDAIDHLLRQVLARGISPTYVRRLLTANSETRARLSERELAVLRCIAAGKSNQEIAQEFVVALSTIKTHINNIYARLGVHSRTQAIARAKALHLLD